MKEEVYLEYGVGIMSYFQLQWGLIRLFFFLTILASIQMILYWQTGGLVYIKDQVGIYVLSSFGNMGFAKPICAKENIIWENDHEINFSFQCESTTVIKDVVDSGILFSTVLPGGTDNTLSTCDSKNSSINQ